MKLHLGRLGIARHRSKQHRELVKLSIEADTTGNTPDDRATYAHAFERKTDLAYTSLTRDFDILRARNADTREFTNYVRLAIDRFIYPTLNKDTKKDLFEIAQAVGMLQAIFNCALEEVFKDQRLFKEFHLCMSRLRTIKELDITPLKHLLDTYDGDVLTYKYRDEWNQIVRLF